MSIFKGLIMLSAWKLLRNIRVYLTKAVSMKSCEIILQAQYKSCKERECQINPSVLAFVHHIVMNTFMGTINLKPSVVGCSWNLNISVIEGLFCAKYLKYVWSLLLHRMYKSEREMLVPYYTLISCPHLLLAIFQLQIINSIVSATCDSFLPLCHHLQ
jgi:hypothetical protein